MMMEASQWLSAKQNLKVEGRGAKREERRGEDVWHTEMTSAVKYLSNICCLSLCQSLADEFY